MKPVLQLNLNRHPVDVPNGSLIMARSIRVSDDGKRLINEAGVVISSIVYENQVVGVIPTYKDLIVFTNTSQIFINDQLVSSDWNWEGGEVFGTWTQNVEDDYIIAISERNLPNNKLVPLKVINISKNTKDGNETKYTIAPDIPKLNFKFKEYVEGEYIPNGIYYFYIRYVIDSNNYTRWMFCNIPVYAYNIKSQKILSYTFSHPMRKANNGTLNVILQEKQATSVGSIFVNEDSNFNMNFKLEINLFEQSDLYKEFQLGFVLQTGDDTKAYEWEKFSIDTSEIIFNGKNATEISLNEIQLNSFGIYNVNTLTNYNDRLYIANYKEDTSVLEYDSSNIDVIINHERFNIGIDSKTDSTYVGMFWQNLSSSTASKYQLTFSKVYTNILACSYVEYYNKSHSVKISGDTIVEVKHNDGTIHNVPAKSVYFASRDYYVDYNHPGSGYICYKKDRDVYTLPNGQGQVKVYLDGRDRFVYGYAIRMTEPVETIIDNTKDNNYNFNERIGITTLIPGEVYSFYIHFIKENGNITKGFRIKPKSNEIPLPNITYTFAGVKYVEHSCYLGNRDLLSLNNAIKAWEKAWEDEATASSTTVTFDYSAWGNYKELLNKYPQYKTYQLFGDITTIIDFAIKKCFSFTKFEDDGYILNETEQQSDVYRYGYNYYSNIINDDLFCINYYYNNSYTKDTVLYIPEFNNIVIPDGYIGCFISTEKLEKRKSITGIATMADFSGKEQPSPSDFKKGLRINSSDLYRDSNINGSLLRIEAKVSYAEVGNYFEVGSFNRFLKTIEYLNLPIIAVTSKDIVEANNSADDNTGRESAIIINKEMDMTTIPEITNTDYLVVALINTSDNLYTSKYKNLYPIGNVLYKSNNDTYNYTKEVGYNLGGFVTIGRVPTINQHGVNFLNTGEIVPTDGDKDYYYVWAKNEDKNSYYSNVAGSPYTIIEYPAYSDVPYELLSVKEAPSIITVSYDLVVSSTIPEIIKGIKQVENYLVLPEKINELLKDDYTFDRYKGGNIYDNYTGEEIEIENYSKFIRRSDIQQDESKEVAWRIFQPNAYKQITENRGKITNIVGVGLYLLVHCEYSLFMFNRDASLQTQNKDVQLYIPDAFDVQYKEVFTSSHGFGGLKDYTSWCLDDFGYIFYDSDRYQVLKFNEKNLDILDKGIELLLKEKKFNSCDFAVDTERKRMILSFTGEKDGKITNATISYSLLAEAFISTHNYYYSKAFNTANQLYLFANNNFYIFEENPLIKGRIPIISEDLGITNIFKGIADDNPRKYLSSINIVFNQYPEVIKTLVYISYLFNSSIDKYERPEEVLPPSNNEIQNRRNYSGDRLTITSESCSSGELNLSIVTDNTIIAPNKFMNKLKPRWNCGVWNFNAFRNININPNSYIYGKYFSLDFRFINNATDIEIESIDVNVKQFK